MGNVTLMAITQAAKPIRARLTSQGQITIPKVVRDAMLLEPGDQVEFELGKPVSIKRHQSRSVLEFAGIAGNASARIPETAEELDAVIAEIRRGR